MRCGSLFRYISLRVFFTGTTVLSLLSHTGGRVPAKFHRPVWRVGDIGSATCNCKCSVYSLMQQQAQQISTRRVGTFILTRTAHAALTSTNAHGASTATPTRA